MRCVTSSVRPAWRGITVPAMKPPKISAMPISSVVKAASRTIAKIAVIHVTGTRPASS